jgi:hypothetical protein
MMWAGNWEGIELVYSELAVALKPKIEGLTAVDVTNREIVKVVGRPV